MTTAKWVAASLVPANGPEQPVHLGVSALPANITEIRLAARPFLGDRFDLICVLLRGKRHEALTNLSNQNAGQLNDRATKLRRDYLALHSGKHRRDLPQICGPMLVLLSEDEMA
jgi:hypothetical protein